MKARESGMPDEAWWQSFFDPERLLARLLPAHDMDGGIVEFGAGYGTFTLPAARMTSGIVTALDIDASMIEHLRRKTEACGQTNIRAVLRDVVADGTGVAGESQTHAMILALPGSDLRNHLISRNNVLRKRRFLGLEHGFQHQSGPSNARNWET